MLLLLIISQVLKEFRGRPVLQLWTHKVNFNKALHMKDMGESEHA